MGMLPPPVPADDKARVAALQALEILDTDPEQEFDAIAKLAAEICAAPIALVSLVDESRTWFKSRVGLDAAQEARELSYCAHAIVDEETTVVANAALDPRFVDNPARTGPRHAEFYAGVPLRLSSGHVVGTLCVIDHQPRSLSPAQHSALEALGAQVVRLLELRRTTLIQRETLASLRAAEDSLRRDSNSGPAPLAREWSRSAFALAWVLAAASLLATLWVRSTVTTAAEARLRHATERGALFLEERAQAYGEILRGAGAFFRGSEHVRAAEFHAYTAALELERNYPGLLGLGFAERVPRAQLQPWLDEVRREIPDMTVTSSGHAPELAINRLLEPLAHNLPARGFDARSEPKRARAMASSLRTHDLALTKRVRLQQDPAHGPGFVMYLPVPSSSGTAPALRGGASFDAAGGTRGWVFAVLRARDLVAGMQAAAGADIELSVKDDPSAPPLIGRPATRAQPVHRVEVPIADRRFRVEGRPGHSFLSWFDQLEPWAVLLLGFGASGLAFALTTSMRRTEERSGSLALRMTEALRRGERELRAVIDGTTDLILTFAADGRLMLTNRAFRHALGYSEQQASAMTIYDVVHPDARIAFARTVADAPDQNTTGKIETLFCARSGATIEVEGALSFFVEHEKKITRAIFRDVSSRRQAERALRAANEALERLATTDPLTGVANRRVFDDRLADELARARRNGTALAVALLDVDCFKLYNDTYGHPQGDECLKRVAASLRSVGRRAGELAARYGGEEFALILPGSDIATAALVAAKARDRIEMLAIPHVKNPGGVVTASFGVALFDPTTMQDGKDLIQAADTALYRAKLGGRNRVELAA